MTPTAHAATGLAGPQVDHVPGLAAVAPQEKTRHSWIADYQELCKVRVTSMVVLTAWAGFYLGSMRSGITSMHWGLVESLFGIALVSCGASVMNQVIERRTDARMVRTAQRPLAAGRFSQLHGFALGMASFAAGALVLTWFTNPVTVVLTLLTGFTYVAIYTPLKRYTTLATFIGAFPGAMPPLLGWTAARGIIEWPAVALFAILFVWQFPHFMAIAWLYRDDYAKAGIRMLPVVQPDGWSTVCEALIYAVLMIPVSVVPYYLHLTGQVYLVSAMCWAWATWLTRFALPASPGRSPRPNRAGTRATSCAPA